MAAAPSYPTFIEGLRMLVLESIITSVTVNYVGGEPPDPQACSREPINKLECVAVDGMKGIFWRQVFTPSAVASRGASHVWLFDSDLAVWPALGGSTAPREPLMRRLDSSNRRGDDARLRQRGME